MITTEELALLYKHGTSDVKALVTEVRRLRRGVTRVLRGNYLSTAKMENALREVLNWSSR